MLMLIILLLFSIWINAQDGNVLIGKWETSYEEDGEKFYVTYEFKNINRKLKCYTLYIKDDKDEGAKYYSLAMEKIRMKEGKGDAKYKYNEGNKKYVFDAKLILKKTDILYVSYSFWGYSNTEIWKKVK